MAKLRQGIFGPISGKVGPIVGSHWKNIPYIRLASQKKNRERTPAQIESSKKFGYINNWLVPFHPYATAGFHNMAMNKTELNVAYSLNYKAFTGIYPDIVTDYTQIILSKGSLAQLPNAAAKLIAVDMLEINWEPYHSINSSFDDQVMLVIYSPERKIADGFIGGTKRSELQCRFKFNPNLVGMALEVYISLTSLNRKSIANSQYLGRILPL